MLKELSINDFAIIDNLNIEFDEGLNLLTGETGSGKSIIIDALSVVLGSRSTKDMIKSGKDKAIIEAMFFVDNKAKDIILENGLDVDEDYIVITKEINKAMPSISRINGRPVTVTTLKKITTKLVDISGQHEHQSLLDIQNHILLIDSFGDNDFKKSIKNIQNSYNTFLSEKKHLKEMNISPDERVRNIDLLKYQIDEIEESQLIKEEDVRLESEFLILSNMKNIEIGINKAISMIKDDYQDVNIKNGLSKITSILRDFNKYDAKFVIITDRLENISYELQDITKELENYCSNMESDEERLSLITNRLNVINKLKKKYGNTIEKILEYKDNIEKKYNALLNFDKEIIDIENRLKELEVLVRSESYKISSNRKIIALFLEDRISQELMELNMDKVKFKVEFSEKQEISYNGLDNIEFLISTNPGEELKSLSRIVSGGEMSRIMLGFKSIIADKDEIPSIIFDEIDTGISGRTAQIVGEKICKISKNHQVIAISHLPQIAALADSHYVISKSVYNSKTNTVVKKLDEDERIKEIARLIGGVDLTKLTLDHANEMIEMAKKIKKNM